MKGIRASLAFAAALLFFAVNAHGQQLTWRVTEINPKQSNLEGDDPLKPKSASGGRVNGLARGANDLTYFAASEWGGLFKTTDRGRTWKPVGGHKSQATWDVEVDASLPNKVIVYASSFYDGHRSSGAGVNISTDGGETWKRTAVVPPNHRCRPYVAGGRDTRRAEPSAFGIAIDPSNPQNVYIGTSCGLARSKDRGATWDYVDPTPSDGADSIWDVAVHDGAIDLCGADGHRRSLDGGNTWTTAGAPRNELAAGRCSIAAAPYASHRDLLFATVGTILFASVNGGGSWTELALPEKQRNGRIPFVTTNRRDQGRFDIYYGDVELFRMSCTTVPTTVCDTPQGAATPWVSVGQGAHDDVGDIAFSSDGCPALFSNDGGVYRNVGTAGDCHAIRWQQADVTTNALWAWGLAGGDATIENAKDLYFGSQDNGLFATPNARAGQPEWNPPSTAQPGNNRPDWTAKDAADVYEVTAKPGKIVYTTCCFGSGRANRIRIVDRATGTKMAFAESAHPPGNIVASSDGNVIVRLQGDGYVMVTDKGVFSTKNLLAANPDWKRIGTEASLGFVQDVKVGMRNGVPTFYAFGPNKVPAASATSLYLGSVYWRDGAPRYGKIFKHVGADPGTPWIEVRPPNQIGGFGTFAVDPLNPDRLIVSSLRGVQQGGHAPPTAAMWRSNNGGRTWEEMGSLNAKMAPATVHSANDSGPVRNTWFWGYAQPSLIKFDPADPNIIVAGGNNSGVFVTFNNGQSWTLLTDPAQGRPRIPRPRFAHFDHHPTNPRLLNLYIGSQGRGLWRIELTRP